MAVGFGLLRLSPQQFWSMTPRELECAMSVLLPIGSPPLRRHELDALMRAFPDAEVRAFQG